jgi:ornithine decarboxylase
MGIPAYIEHQYGVRRYHGTNLDVVQDIINQGQQDAFFVVDLGNLVRKLEMWQNYLPRVEPFYAVKCNPDPVILATLHSLGVKFDCASRGEIEMVLSLPNAQPTDIIYANCCKAKSMIAFAAEHNVTPMIQKYNMNKVNDAWKDVKDNKIRYRAVLVKDDDTFEKPKPTTASSDSSAASVAANVASTVASALPSVSIKANVKLGF